MPSPNSIEQLSLCLPHPARLVCFLQNDDFIEYEDWDQKNTILGIMTTQRLSELEAQLRADPSSPLNEQLPAVEDFARLVPLSQSAQDAFNEVAINLARDPSALAHVGQYMYIRPAEPYEPARISRSSSPYFSPSPSGTDPDMPPSYSGYFKFSLTILPEDWRRGWVIGAGRPDKPNFGVDFLLTASASRDRVKGRHVRVAVDRTTRVLVLKKISNRPDTEVTLNGQKVDHYGLPLSAARQSVGIGNLLYSLEFQENPHVRSQYKQALNDLIESSGAADFPSISTISPTPSSMHIHVGDYWIQSPQAYGSFGIVMPAVRLHTVEGFAAKRVKRTKGNLQSVIAELQIMDLLGRHPHVCSLRDELYTDGDRHTMGEKPVSDVYMILEPLAHKSLADYIGSEPLYSLRIRALHHLAQGLRYIHLKGVIHRDIKPSNLLIVEEPFRLVIADFGHSTTEIKSRDHDKGTLEYLAPEIVALKRVGSGDDLKVNRIKDSHWTPKADVFAFGLVGYELLYKTFRRNAGRMLDGKIHSEILHNIDERPDPTTTKLGAFLKEVLCWEMEGRPTMSTVCLTSVWPPGFVETSTSELKRKASR